jgi:hypothetical protein
MRRVRVTSLSHMNISYGVVRLSCAADDRMIRKC